MNPFEPLKELQKEGLLNESSYQTAKTSITQNVLRVAGSRPTGENKTLLREASEELVTPLRALASQSDDDASLEAGLSAFLEGYFADRAPTKTFTVDTDPLLTRLFENNDFEGAVAEFTVKHRDEFEGEADVDGEQSLKNMELYRAYEKQFEQMLSRFLDSENLTAEEFMDHCQKELEGSTHSAALQALLAMTSYESFVTFMQKEQKAFYDALEVAEDLGLW